jgi:uncharacterized protein (TIGR03437 family)
MNASSSRLLLILALSSISWAQPTTINLSQDLVTLGIASSNMTPNQPTLDAGPLLTSAVQYATAHKVTNIIANPGTYYFLTTQPSGAHVVLTGASNLTIDFQGSSLIMTVEQHVGFQLNGAANVTLQNFSLDYQQVPFTQLQVVSVNAALRQIQYSVPAGWRVPSVFSTLPQPSTLNGYYVFFFRSGERIGSLLRFSFQTPVSGNAFTLADAGTATSATTLSQIRPGDVAVLQMRSNTNALFANVCTGCTFRNIQIYSSPGVAFTANSMQGSTVDHVYVMPKPGTDRLVSSNADGISFAQPGANNTVVLSRVIRNLDDGYSPHYWVLGLVQSQPSAQVLAVQRQFFASLPNGSPVVFESAADGSLLGSATIVSQSPDPSQPAVAGQTITITFDRILPTNLTGAAVYTTDPTLRGGNSLFDRVTAQEQVFPRGMSLWGLMNTTVRGSFISHSGFSAIYAAHQLAPTDWMTAPLSNLTLSNNAIEDTNSDITSSISNIAAIEATALAGNSTPMPSSPNQNITITGNFIQAAGHAGIWFANTNDGAVANNYILNPDAVGPVNYLYSGYLPYLSMPLAVEASSGVVPTGNTVDPASRRMFVTDPSFNRLAAYAPGSTVLLNAYGIGALASPAVTITDSSGAVTQVMIASASANAVTVKIPASVALGGAYLELSSGGARYFGAIFSDSVDNNPAVNGCTYSLSPSSTAVASGGGNVAILVVTQAGCTWQSLDSDTFITLGAASTGTGVGNVTLGANASTVRSTTVQIGGKSVVLTQAAAQGGPAIASVVNGASYAPQIAPGSWMTITGTNLSATTRIWTGADFLGSGLPVQLDGVSVTVNGLPAFVYYVSPTQLNVLAPDDATAGKVTVMVSNTLGASNTFTVDHEVVSPAFFLFTAKYPAAVHLSGVLVGSAGLIAGANFAPAAPGETIELFATGFGLTSPPSPSATILAQAVPLATTLSVTIGGMPAKVLFAGLASNGLVQLNVTVPTGLPNGDAPIVASVNSVQTPANLFLTIHN